jgi:hypothetical protein
VKRIWDAIGKILGNLMRTLRNMLRTHWDVDVNTLGTTKIKKNSTLSTLSPS